eukprot:m51a1_g8126 hypothetical protein (434) ;mRNA; r:195091-199953
MTQVWVNWVAVWDVGWAHTPKKGKPERERERLGVPSSPDQAPAPQASMACRSAPVEREAMAAAAAPAAEPELSPEPQQQQDIEPEKANEQPMEQDKNTEQQDGDTEQQDDAEAEQQDKQQDEQEENCQINWDIPASDRSGSVYWACVEDEWTLVVLLNLIIPVNTSMKKQLNCLVLNPAFSVAGVQKKNTRFYIDYILRNCEGAINFPLLQQYRQATTPAARQDYDNAVVQASIIAISTLTRNRVIPTKEEAVQARTDCLEVLYFTTPFWDPTDNTVQNATTSLTAVAAEVRRLSRLSARGRAMDGPKAMLNAVRSIKDKIKGAQQASKETSSASGDEAESSSSESIDELRGKKVVECNVDDDQEEHKEKTTTRKRTREESNDEDRTWWSLQPTEAWDIHDIDTMSLQDARTALRQAVSNARRDEGMAKLVEL